MVNQFKQIVFYLAFSAFTMSALGDISYFTKAYNSRGNYMDTPKTGQNLSSLSIQAAKDEYEPVVLLMRSTKKHGNLTISLDAALSSGGNTIAKENIDIRIAADFKHWLDTRRYIRYPYVLNKLKTFSLMPNQTARIWLTVFVPPDAKAGNYKSSLTIREAGKIIKKINLNLKVWPFTLNKVKASKMMFAMYFPTYALPKWAQSVDYLTKCYTDMKKHGMNSVGPNHYISHGNVLYSTQKGKWLKLDTTLKALRKSKILSSDGIYISMNGKMLGVSKIRELVKVLKNEKFDVKLYGIDEPGLEKYRQDLTRKLVPKLKKAVPDVPVVTAICKKGVAAVGSYYDGWIYSAFELNDQVRKKAAKEGKILYSYDCGLAAVDPLVARFYWGMFSWRMKTRGAMQWSYGQKGVDRFNIWQQTPESFDPSLDYMYSFVCLTREGPLPTVVWENVREGIDDYRYISQLRNLIKTARLKGKKDAADKAEKVLKELHSKINPENYRKAFEKGKKFKGLRGSAYNRGNPEPNLTAGSYSLYREKIAGEIIKLRKELKK